MFEARLALFSRLRDCICLLAGASAQAINAAVLAATGSSHSRLRSLSTLRGADSNPWPNQAMSWPISWPVSDAQWVEADCVCAAEIPVSAQPNSNAAKRARDQFFTATVDTMPARVLRDCHNASSRPERGVNAT